MRTVLPLLALLGATQLAHAGDAILYATAATTNGVDGFRIRNNGSLAPAPREHASTRGTQPRRLIVGANGMLYVVEIDRVEAFRIGPCGGLEPAGSTEVLRHPNMNALDAAVSPDGAMLYVPQNGRDRIVAYPVADGRLAEHFTSCIQGPSSPGFQRVQVQGSYLYVTAASQSGHMAVYPLADRKGTGRLELELDDCGTEKGAPEVTCPASARRRLLRPRSFVLAGDLLYVESLLDRRLLAFRLTGGQFDPPTYKKTGEPVPFVRAPCLQQDDVDHTAVKGPFRWQKPSSKTRSTNAYQDVVLDDGTLFGSEFLRGRIDAFRLKPDEELPRGAAGTTKEDVRGSPVGLASRGSVLYVAAGELDRVQAFHLGANGRPDPTPFSETDEQTNSFPNALAVAELTGSCPPP
jgi:hypothetical protein